MNELDPIAFLSHPACALHETGSMHPERPDRLAAVRRGALAAGLGAALVEIEAPAATDEQLLRVHSEAHLATLRRLAPRQGLVHLDPDTVIGPHSLAAALRAAGAVVHAVDLVLGGRYRTAFCNVRPPGHHACRDRAMGFCLFDNIAIGAAHALAAHGLERVAIADFDVHHGNGTEDVFADRATVLLCSSFQEHAYPDPGPASAANVLHVPLPTRLPAVELRARIVDAFTERLASFGPQLLLISAGFDGHASDPLADLSLRDEDYGWITRRLRAAVAPTAHGRIVSVLEGGYDLDALAGSAAAHLRALAEKLPAD